MAKHHIDEHDRAILNLLRDNGRLTNQELADIIGLSASQCSRRRIALEQGGLILGYHAQLSPEGDGTPLVGLIEVRLARQAVDASDGFLAFARQEPAIRDVLKLTGDHDFLIRVAVSGLQELNTLIRRLSDMRDCVGHLRTSVVLERVKENGVVLPEGEL